MVPARSRPWAGRLPGRLRAPRYLPVGPAGASRHPGQPFVLFVSLTQLLALGYGAGNASRGLGCTGPGDPATDPYRSNTCTPAHGTHYTHCRAAAKGQRRAFGASGFTASARFLDLMPSVHSRALSVLSILPRRTSRSRSRLPGLPCPAQCQPELQCPCQLETD